MTRHQFRTRVRDVLTVLMTTAYLCITLSGVAFAISTPQTIENASDQWQGYVWASWLIVGGAFSASDLFTGRRGGELFGTIPISGAAFFWGAALLWRQWHEPGIAGAGTGLAWLLFAFFFVMVARFIMMAREFNVAKAAKALG